MSITAFSAIGTTWWIEIFTEINAERLDVIIRDIQLFVTKFENRYSRFTYDSLISTLNRERTLSQPDTECRAILQYGLDLYTRSNGLFNVLVGETLLARGYDASYSFKATTQPLTIPNPREHLGISLHTISLTAGSIDLGGYGKGYLIDLIAKRLQTHHNINEFLINGGGDMFGTSDAGNPISLYLEDPLSPGRYLGTTTIYNQGFAASSPHKRAWNSAGQTYTHIVDPHHNLTEQFDASFVIAATAVTADAFATVALFDTEANFASLAEREHLSIARYTATTSSLTTNESFRLTPLQ